MDVQASRAVEGWKHWQGEIVDGKFRLLEYLGGSDHSAVFLTTDDQGVARKLVIKLTAEDPETAAFQLARWDLVRKLSHPHLIRLFASGRSRVANTPVLYVVMEYAPEDLSQILPERPLTPAEVHEMLSPLLDVLDDLHSKGFVHGHVKPSNIMAVDDRLKLSSDGILQSGESTRALQNSTPYSAPELRRTGVSVAGDVWSLGITLIECLTQRVAAWENGRPRIPETLPLPFPEVIRNCLELDPQRRSTISDIKARLQPSAPVVVKKASISAPPKKSRWPYMVPVAVAIVLLAILAVRAPKRLPEVPRTPPSTPQTLPMTAVTPGIVHGAVVSQVVPKVPESARETIQGTVRVTVKVAVDPAGNVTRATLDSPGPSKYFAGLSLQAARGWKFSPTKIDGRDVASEWVLRYQFERTGTRVFAVQASP